MKRTTRVFLGLCIVLSLVQGVVAANFNSETARFKIDKNGKCKLMDVAEINTILYEVNETHTRGYLKSINYYDRKQLMNYLFMFSNGTMKNGLPDYLMTFTTYDGCLMFIENPAPFMQYLR